MCQLPQWVSYLQALAVPLVAAAIALFGAWVAACQMWIAREKLRIDAFDRQYNRRVAVYEATRTLLADIFHKPVSEDMIRDFGWKTLDAQFLFNKQMYKFLSEVRNRVAIYANAEAHVLREPPGAEQDEYKKIYRQQLDWITEQGEQSFAERFEPFLVYKPSRRPWYLRFLPSLEQAFPRRERMERRSRRAN
jgi:hypothetical protein